MVADLKRWPYEPEIDRYGMARAPIPQEARPFVEKGYEVELTLPDGTTLKGVVTNYSRNSWIARVKVETGEG